jgi:hypothetical protein
MADVTVSHVLSYVLVTPPPPTDTTHQLVSRGEIAVTGVLTPLRRRQRGWNSKAAEMRGCTAALHTNGAAVRTGNREEGSLESSRNSCGQGPSAFTLASWIRSVVTLCSWKNYVSTSEVNEHVTKRSTTALGHSLTDGAIQFGRIREAAIIELFSVVSRRR